MSRLADALEPLAGLTGDTSPDTHLADVVALSQAISLKRIADALSAGELPGGLCGQITQLAWEAGQNLGRGFDVGRSR